MKIEFLSSDGIHEREIRGVDILKENLPNDWFAFANLEMVQPGKEGRQVDIILVIEDRIIIADLKDWHGEITSANGRWYQNGRSREQSPVVKIADNARILKNLLDTYLKKHSSTKNLKTPWIDSCVIMTGKCSFESLPENDIAKIFRIEDFCRIIKHSKNRENVFGHRFFDKSNPVTSKNNAWRQALSKFFDPGKGNFKAQEQTYANHAITSDIKFSHPSEGYNEFFCEEKNDASHGLIRIWDLPKIHTSLAAHKYRDSFLGREQRALSYLFDTSNDAAHRFFRPKGNDEEKSINFWEIFEKRRQSIRLSEFAHGQLKSFSIEARITLSTSLLSTLEFLHQRNVSHLDIGSHSIWVEPPETIKLSHLYLSKFNDDEPPEDINKALSINTYSDTLFTKDKSLTPFSQDALACGQQIYLILTGKKFDTSKSVEQISSELIQENNSLDKYKNWLMRSVGLDHSSLFQNASEMYEAFLSIKDETSTAIKLSSERLNSHKTWGDCSLTSMLIKIYPTSDQSSLNETENFMMYPSKSGDKDVWVKIWKKKNWGDEESGAHVINSFLETIELAKLSNSKLFPNILEAGYFEDHVAIISTVENGKPLAKLKNAVFLTEKDLFASVEWLMNSFQSLHDLDIYSSSLNEEKTFFYESGNGIEFYFQDFFDLAPKSINTRSNNKLSAAQHDRSFVINLSKLLINNTNEKTDKIAELRTIIDNIESAEHPFASFLPVFDFFHRLYANQDEAENPYFVIEISGINGSEEFFPDEGVFHVYKQNRTNRDTLIAFIGSEKVLNIYVDSRTFKTKHATIAHREQNQIGRLIRNKSQASFNAIIEINKCQKPDWSKTDELILASKVELKAPIYDEQDDFLAVDDNFIDNFPVAEEASDFSNSNTPAIWQKLLDLEEEMHCFADITSESYFSERFNRFFAEFALNAGNLDFDRSDRVDIQVFSRSNNDWVSVGKLDIDLTKNERLAIINGWSSRNKQILRPGDKVRLISWFEEEGRKRRKTASKRILEGRSIIPNLIEWLTPSSNLTPDLSWERIDADHIDERYGLNQGQTDAFIKIWNQSPISILQGPPGTGKTKFIGAFAHAALASNNAKNVLIASQSHEAVNNATEAILELFDNLGGSANLVRVGSNQDVLSERLEPFHTSRIEQNFKDRFSNQLNQKLRLTSQYLGLPPKFSEEFFILTGTLKPILNKFKSLDDAIHKGEDDSNLHSRYDSLCSGLEAICQKLNFNTDELDINLNADEIYEQLLRILAKRNEVTDIDSIVKLRQIFSLSRDWIEHVGTRKRNFEEFLVHTREIVSGTCVGLGRSALGLSDTAYDLVIIDEAARCNPGELAVPLQSAKKIILVGDHNQLTPFYDNDFKKALKESDKEKFIEWTTSDFERLFSSKAHSKIGSSLTTQYRMLPTIGKLVSSIFYEPSLTLQHGRTDMIIPETLCPHVIEKQITWIDTSADGDAAFEVRAGRTGTSFSNPAESNRIVELLLYFEKNDNFINWLNSKFSSSDKPIGIICAYSGQISQIKESIAKSDLSPKITDYIKIDTVDSYQGKENLMVIYSIVRNNDLNGGQTIKQGFLQNKNRINVALSRAMDKLIIVGSISRWPNKSPLQLVSKEVERLSSLGNATIFNKSTLLSGN